MADKVDEIPVTSTQSVVEEHVISYEDQGNKTTKCEVLSGAPSVAEDYHCQSF